jgi:hypothetical protein
MYWTNPDHYDKMDTKGARIILTLLLVSTVSFHFDTVTLFSSACVVIAIAIAIAIVNVIMIVCDSDLIMIMII